MAKLPPEIIDILVRYTVDNVTPEEQALLDRWADLDPDGRQFLAKIKDPSWLSTRRQEFLKDRISRRLN